MNALATCCLTYDDTTLLSSLTLSDLYQRVKPPQGTILFINLLEKAVDSKGLYLHLMSSCHRLMS